MQDMCVEGRVSICCIVKNEAPYIKEWIEFHLLVGFKMFFIYDNESTDNLKEILKPYIEDGVVIYAYVKGTGMQYPVYNDCIANYKNCCDWIAFIDADEFLVPVRNDSLSEILKDFKTYAGIGINWVFFDSNGHDKKPNGLVIENYTRVETDFNCERCRVIKSIVNPQKVKFCYHPHFFVYRFGEKCVDINKVPTDLYFTKHNSRDVLRVNHYYTKSKEEYLEKINREMADFKNAKRKEINLADLNFPNGVEDYTALKFLPALKKRMEDI